MAGILEAVAAGFRFATSWFGHRSRRSELNNAPDMKARAVQQDAVNADSEAAEAIRRRDLERIRNAASE
jgi:hypothetical protein